MGVKTEEFSLSKVTPQLLSALRAELIETEKTGADFVKWKLIAVAAVASLALGVGQQRNGDPPPRALICLIPLICAYVDLMSADLAVRILSIAAFLRSEGDVYEQWVQQRRTMRWQNPFALAPMAVHGSSVAINFAVLIFAMFGTTDKPAICMYTVAGFVGLLLAIWLWIIYVRHGHRLKQF